MLEEKSKLHEAVEEIDNQTSVITEKKLANSVTKFGADVENYYSPQHYAVYSPNAETLEYIVNRKTKNNNRIGRVKYTSTERLASNSPDVPVYINPSDFVGKRTAIFSKTRVGKSNLAKIIVTCIHDMSKNALTHELPDYETNLDNIENLRVQFPVGQLIMDPNGEYANPNLQDEGTALFDRLPNAVHRYSITDKTKFGFKTMKFNFYNNILEGFDLIKMNLRDDNGYITSFKNINLLEPTGYKKYISDRTSDEKIAAITHDRKLALYRVILYKAGYKVPTNMQKIYFNGDVATINTLVKDKNGNSLEPHKGLSLIEAQDWFETVYPQLNGIEFQNYQKNKGRSFFDDDMLTMLKVLTRKKELNQSASLTGYRLLHSCRKFHTELIGHFEKDIIAGLRKGETIIVDLSDGEEETAKLYCQKITKAIYEDSMQRFTSKKPNNFIQFYFEEAHNIFPNKTDIDLDSIFLTLAKVGAKLNLGMTCLTQEVSDINPIILNNTENWFVGHLNNTDEIKLLSKYYDFADFSESLSKFSAERDIGFFRMRTASNSFFVPIKVDRFLAEESPVDRVKKRNISDFDIFPFLKDSNDFLGMCLDLNFDQATFSTCDAYKNRALGIPKGALLLAFYRGEDNVEEIKVLRVIDCISLPTDNDNNRTRYEFYNSGMDISGIDGSSKQSPLDSFTNYHLSHSGLKCRILGTYYKEGK